MPCLDDKLCIQWFDSDTWYGGELGKSYISMTVQTVVLLILAWYFNHVIPQEFGIRKHPLFFLSPLKILIPKSILKRFYGTHPALSINDGKDTSVYQHEQLVMAGDYDSEPLVIKGLRKRYGSKVALKEFTLGVRKGECFGLLGPNGAGKTTLMSVLYGLIPPTKGSASVAGYPLHEITSIQRHIGVSMQFDVLWDRLTVSEHLTFYSRLKGVRYVRPHVEMLMESVGLADKRDAYASSLSGGMRRRLSLAIAMIGSPSVVFLDEPTTGLDPQSRRSVWDCIAKFQQDRAMVLCTHSMDEASVLCQRLGIMCNGELRFVGTQFELRDKFIHEYTYRLDVIFDEERRNDVKRYIYDLADESQIYEVDDKISVRGGKMSFGLSRQVKLSTVWKNMEHEDARIKGGIKEWALGQMHLETMFIKLVRDQGDEILNYQASGEQIDEVPF
jgi:ABC-type multidrug transport system ATPase subunit